MGGSGGWPVHLHFQVFFNRENRNPWTPAPAEVVDPMGGLPADGRPDGWNSLCVPLFKNASPVSCAPSSAGDTLTSSGVTVQIPGGAVRDGQVVSLSPIPPSGDLVSSLRELGRSFYLRLLDLAQVLDLTQVPSLSKAMPADTGRFSQPVQITVDYASASITHLNSSLLALYWQDPSSGTWTKLPGTLHPDSQTISAQVSQAGNYAVQAPLICPADSNEPWDDAPSWKDALTQDTILNRIFDTPSDEDWISLDMTGGSVYILRTENLSAGVDTALTLYGMDQQTVLASDDNGGSGKASLITWLANTSGIYFLRVSQAGGSQSGCGSSYQIRVSGNRQQLFLPAVSR
jgi:hypothetical protein